MIDIRSDTVTKPSKEMLEHIITAEVGDDEYKEDPTVNELEEFTANLLGFEAGLFVSSGLMGNQISLLNHTNPGDEVITTSDSHIQNYEHGAASFLSRIQFRNVQHKDGNLDLEDLDTQIKNLFIINQIYLPSQLKILIYHQGDQLFLLRISKTIRVHFLI